MWNGLPLQETDTVRGKIVSQEYNLQIVRTMLYDFSRSDQKDIDKEQTFT